MRKVGFVFVVLAVAASEVGAQTSVYSVLGLGYPGRAVGIRTRSLGGGMAAMDPGSAINPGAVAAYRQLSVSVTSTSSFRNYSVKDTAVSGLHDTRFAYGSLGGPFSGTPLTFALSFSTYLDRTYDVVDTGQVVIRGDTVGFFERISSDGAVIDLRGAIGWQAVPQFRLGAAFHVLSGTTENVFFRDFDSDQYAPLRRQDRVSFAGIGGSVGFMYLPTPYLRLAGSVRVNGDIKVKLNKETTFGQTPLPTELSGGVFFAVLPTVRLSSTAIYRTWSTSAEGFLAADAANAFDTFEIGSGLEIQTSSFPLRLGFRWAQLPYSPTGEQPREINLSFGSGIGLARGRATFEFAIERTMRDGGGVSERAWVASFELRVVP